jgi:hypothetical protein
MFRVWPRVCGDGNADATCKESVYARGAAARRTTSSEIIRGRW